MLHAMKMLMTHAMLWGLQTRTGHTHMHGHAMDMAHVMLSFPNMYVSYSMHRYMHMTVAVNNC